MNAPFLVEIGTEELPPKTLYDLEISFLDGIKNGFEKENLRFVNFHSFSTPRRLAVLLTLLETQAPTKEVVAWGPPQAIAFDNNGKPTKAAEAFAKKNGIDVGDLKTENDGKQQKLCHRSTKEGAKAADIATQIVEDALKALPIAKRMRWGSSRTEFVRPVKWLVLMHGSNVIDAEILGVRSSNVTYGHRVMSNGPISIDDPLDYKDLLKNRGKVIADYNERCRHIEDSVRAVIESDIPKADSRQALDAALMPEVTALNEWPVALCGRFDKEFLKVPREALISSMRDHQKYFHVEDNNGQLLPYFITVANIDSNDKAQVVSGNERVIRPRLADAAFFFETDKKTSLENRREQLKKIVFQAQLGTVYQKTERVAKLVEVLAPYVGADPTLAKRAAELSKSDLVTDMVLEFSDLQGLMGREYALNDGEPPEVADALFHQYRPRFAGEELPESKTSITLALADRIDTLVGIFGIGMKPTGSRDPFALRRASLGVLRLLVESDIDLNLKGILDQTATLYDNLPQANNVSEQVLTYITDRFEAIYKDDGYNYPAEIYMTVAAKKLDNLLDIHLRTEAVYGFSKLDEAQALAAANKRVSNILSKLGDDYVVGAVDRNLLKEQAEKDLASALDGLEVIIKPLLDKREYTSAMKHLASLQTPVDQFFDDVMVMADDEALRDNRIALLTQLRNLFLEIADISLLVPAK